MTDHVPAPEKQGDGLLLTIDATASPSPVPHVSPLRPAEEAEAQWYLQDTLANAATYWRDRDGHGLVVPDALAAAIRSPLEERGRELTLEASNARAAIYGMAAAVNSDRQARRAAEAQVAKLREALEQTAVWVNELMGHGLYADMIATRLRDIAAETVQEGGETQ